MVYAGELWTVHLSVQCIFIFVQAGVSCKWANDSQHFLLEHYDTICHSPSHIYHSALPLSPFSSWVRKCYSAELSGEVKAVKGLPSEWGTCFRTVVFDSCTLGLASWTDTVAVGLQSGEIITLNGTTGNQTASLSGHTSWVRSLAFSSNGKSLVSGSDDKTIKLWDVQTGGLVRTFHGHTGWICCISISVDSTTIASGSYDKTICLWDIQTGGCHCIVRQQDKAKCVSFSPIHSQHLISASGNKVQQWDTDGHQVNLTHKGTYVAFSLDGTQFAVCQGAGIVVQNSDSGVVVVEFRLPRRIAEICCFSPDGRLIAVAAKDTIYVWDITGLYPHLVKTFVGHGSIISFFVFTSPYSLVTSSRDKSVKFWQIDITSTDPVMEHSKPTPPASAPIKSITLQAMDGVFVSSDLDGIVRTWDISTGLSKTSFQTPAKDPHRSDVRLVDGRLIYIWHADEKIHIWDVEKEKILQTLSVTSERVEDIKLSGDGSNVFCLHIRHIEIWSTWTGEVMGKVEVDVPEMQSSLIVNGSRVWVHSPYFPACNGWDFGIQGSPPVQLPNTPSLRLSDTKLWDVGLSRVNDTVTGMVVLQLGGTSFARVIDVQLDGWYFLVHYESGEALILDFNDVLLW